MKKLIILFILSTSSLILIAQTQDSCICYTDDMDKEALECLANEDKKNDLIQNLSLQLYNANNVSADLTTINIDLEAQNTGLIKENHQLNLKLTRAKKNTPYFTVGGFTIGVGATIFIFKKISD